MRTPPRLKELLILLLYSQLISATDIGHEDRKIIMQADLETIVITADLYKVGSHLDSIENKLAEAREAILGNILSKGTTSDHRITKGIMSIVENGEQLVKQVRLRYTELLETHDDDKNGKKQKRALEILGEFLNTITGVPSAHDHRMVLEKLNAIKSRSEGLENLLETNTALNRQMIQTLHLHEEKFDTYKTQLETFDHYIGKNENNIEKTIMSVSILAKVITMAQAFNSILARSEQILARGDLEKLSRYSISELELGELMDKIYMRRKESQPIFDKGDCSYYYKLPLAHSWVDKEKKQINTILQIPVAHILQRHSLKLLSLTNTIHDDLHMAVVNTARNEYRFLSNSDFANCIPSPKGTICQKREINISPKTGCVIKQSNCEKWADKVVHDITNTEILISLPEPMIATLDCDNKPKQEVLLPLVALVHLDLSCSLENLQFTIHKLTFRHMQEITLEHGDGIHFEINNEVVALTQGQLSHMISQMQNASYSIKSLNKTNNDLNQAIQDHRREAGEKWDEISGGWTGWQQLAVWAAIAGEAIMTIAITICICRMYCTILKRGGGRSGALEATKRIDTVRDRVIDLEHQLMLRQRTDNNAVDIESID